MTKRGLSRYSSSLAYYCFIDCISELLMDSFCLMVNLWWGRVTRDAWRLTCDEWRVTYDVWRVTCSSVTLFLCSVWRVTWTLQDGVWCQQTNWHDSEFPGYSIHQPYRYATSRVLTDNEYCIDIKIGFGIVTVICSHSWFVQTTSFAIFSCENYTPPPPLSPQSLPTTFTARSILLWCL